MVAWLPRFKSLPCEPGHVERIRDSSGQGRRRTWMEQNVTDAILFMATRSLDASALFLDITATQMPFVGCG